MVRFNLAISTLILGINFPIQLLASTSEATIWDAFRAPEDISTNGHLIDDLFFYVTGMNIFYFALVCAGLIGFSYFYHHKRHPKAEYTYGNKPKQLLVTTVIGIAVFLSIDLAITVKSNNDLLNSFWKFPTEQEDHIQVEVLAQQWMWNFRYAGADNQFNTEDDILTNHELHLPVGKKVEFRVASKDVIHSLFFPNARIKVDAIPGRITRLWFEPTKVGHFDIACAEMCGTHHYLMQAKLIVHSQEDYIEWLNESKKLAITSTDTTNPDNFWGWQWGK